MEIRKIAVKNWENVRREQTTVEEQPIPIKVTHGKVNANRCAEVSLPYLSFNSITLDNPKQVSSSRSFRGRLRSSHSGSPFCLCRISITNSYVCHKNVNEVTSELLLYSKHFKGLCHIVHFDFYHIVPAVKVPQESADSFGTY